MKEKTAHFPIVDGDIFESGADIIAHQVNCQGVMGSGVAKQVREIFPHVYKCYKEFCSNPQSSPPGSHQPRCSDEMSSAPRTSPLGACLICGSDPDWCERWIANLFGQDNFGYDGKCYTNYDKLREALQGLNNEGKELGTLYGRPTTVAIPYLMGCHRGGGDWEIVSKMIEEELTDCDVTYYRYTAG